MAVTARERKLLLDGEWIETGEWQEVRSPYSGEVVGRIARAGAEKRRHEGSRAAQLSDHGLTPRIGTFSPVRTRRGRGEFPEAARGVLE